MHCAKMFRITCEVDSEYQEKSIYAFSNAPVKKPSNVFSQNHDLTSWVFGSISTYDTQSILLYSETVAE